MSQCGKKAKFTLTNNISWTENGDFAEFFVKNSNVFVSTDCHFCTWKEKKMNEHAALEIVFRYFVPKIIVTTLQITKIVTHVISWNYAYLLKAKSYQIFSAVVPFLFQLYFALQGKSRKFLLLFPTFSPILFCLFASPNLKGWVEKLFHSSQAILMTWISFRKNTKNFEKEKSTICKSKQKY